MDVARRAALVAVMGIGSVWAAGCAGDDDASPATVVVDTDLAADDLAALAFLLESDAVDVAGITVSGTGEVHCPAGLDVVRGLLVVTGDADVPTACGSATPLAGDRAFPDEWRAAADDAYGLTLPAGRPSDAPERTAVELLDELTAEGDVTLVTLGPLTNVAEALRVEPSMASRLASVVVMGGALDVPGNVSLDGGAPSVAEWNLHVDAAAAAEVVAAGVPVRLVALDATNSVPVTPEFVERLRANAHTDVAQLVLSLYEQRVGSGDLYFWDPLAAASVVDPALVTTEAVTIEVVTGDVPDTGATVRSDDGASVDVAVSADGDAFETLFLRTLDGLAPDEPLAEPPPLVGEAVVRLDGTTCTYEGPTQVPPGRFAITFESAEPEVGLGLVHLTGELTVEEVVQWLREHPEGADAVPGIDDVDVVAPGQRAIVTLETGTEGAVCVGDPNAPEPVLSIAGTVTVTG